MGVELKQVLKLSQHLVITPQLQQAIRILQLNYQELHQEIEKELCENPCLEEDTLAVPQEADELIQWLRQMRENSKDTRMFSEASSEEDQFNYEKYLTRSETLFDHLMWQLKHVGISSVDRKVAEYVIGNIDDDGFLGLSTEAIAKVFDTSVKQVEMVLGVIHQFDPVGVGSRSVSECLLIQLLSLDAHPHKALAADIIKDYFPLFLKQKPHEISKKMGVEFKNVVQAFQLITQLNPKPAAFFHIRQPFEDILKPDVFIKKLHDRYIVYLNEQELPRLKVSNSYLMLLSKKGNPSDVQYVRERLKKAVWFVKSIEQRNDTLLRVTKSILNFQREFFDRGLNYLRPLVLKEIADDVGVHESTISRISRSKYVECPQGVFELRFFFNPGLQQDNRQIASESVKNMIRKLIENENMKQPLSDVAIVRLLNESSGVKIARRTVTKYREELGIPSSSVRKKKF
jgi:RNA polymerase sigma-54 factor